MSRRDLERAVYFEEEAERLEYDLSAREEMAIVREGMVVSTAVTLASGVLPAELEVRFMDSIRNIRELQDTERTLEAALVDQVAWFRSHYAECVNL